LKIVIYVILVILYSRISLASSVGCKWIHFKEDVSIGEVSATLNRNRLVAQKILSNPFRAKICGNITKEKIEKYSHDKYVHSLDDSEAPVFKNHFYSAFGLSSEQRDTWTKTFMVAVPTIVVAFGSSAWDWGKNGIKFGFGNEDWFDKNSYSGGADKVGHMTSLYMEKRLATWLALQAGHDMKTAQRYGLYTAGFIGIALEVGDGFSKYKFSTEDLLMDSVGILFAWALDEYPYLDELVGLRFEWWPSHEYRDSRNQEKTDVTSDYSGQKIYLSLKTAGVPYLREHSWSRYLSLDLGFHTRGYEPDLTPEDKNDNIRRRYVSYGIGLNLSTLLFDSYPDSMAARTTSSIIKYWTPPGVSAASKRQEL